MGEFEPAVIGFFCNWCSYTGADLAGTSRIKYPSNLRIIRVMCSGRVDPIMIMKALVSGADGVLVGGCHPGDCHYVRGNLFARKRINALWPMLDALGIDRRRLRLEWIAASEGGKVKEVMNDFLATLREIGPNPFRKEGGTANA
jgi:F420-non-reducing hydrogenase iron-sulfur subunit